MKTIARKGGRGTPQLLGDRVISVNRLHLNLENPRHKPANSEADAIAILCDKELIAGLAADIARRGSLSPLEVLGVIPMDGVPGHYVSLEGNRRTCALIVGSDPSRAPVKLRAQLERLAQKGKMPKEVKAHVFASQAEAKQWIDLRHLGSQGGAGTKEWDPTQKQRAAGDNSKTTARSNDLAVLVLDRLVARRMLTAEQRSRANVSTLTRYLGTPGVRAILGLGSNKELIYTHDHDEVDAALTRLVLDSIEPTKEGTLRVHSRTGSSDRLNYANELKTKGEAPATHLEKPIPAPKPIKVASEPEKGAALRARSATHPDKRTKLIRSDFVVTSKDAALLHFRKEGLALDLKEFSFSANYLLRALVERTMVLFAKKHRVFREGMADRQLTAACADKLKELGLSRDVYSTVSKAGSNDATPYSLQSLGHALHGGTIPVGADLKRHFDTWRPALDAMLATLGTKSGS